MWLDIPSVGSDSRKTVQEKIPDLALKEIESLLWMILIDTSRILAGYLQFLEHQAEMSIRTPPGNLQNDAAHSAPSQCLHFIGYSIND